MERSSRREATGRLCYTGRMGRDDYHSAGELDAALDAAVRGASGRARSWIVGESVRRLPIRAISITSDGGGAPTARPQAMVVANIHGNEVISSELALAVVEDLCRDQPASHVARLLAGCDVTVVPVANPDAREVSMASLSGSGLVNWAPRRNARGVDLNRNWPFPRGVVDNWLPLSGTSSRRLPWCRGPAPFSEPETAALAGLARELRPAVLLNLHSTGQILTYPWSSRAAPSPDVQGFVSMAAAFRAHQTRWSYRAKQSHSWYPIIGSSNDWFHESFGTMAMTVEIAPNGAAAAQDARLLRWPFWAANPLDPAAHIENDRAACIAALSEGLAWKQANGH